MSLKAKLMDVTDLFVCETRDVRKVFSGEVTGGVVWGWEEDQDDEFKCRRKMRSHLQSLAERGRAGRTDLVGAQVDGRHRIVRL